VQVPRLPGHGTTWQEMNTTTWRDWYAAVDAALGTLRERCSTVFVGGLSMGGALALRLAQEHGTAISGLMLVNPAVRVEDPRMLLLPVLRRITRSVAGIASDIKRPGITELAYDRTPLNALASMLNLFALVGDDLGSVRQPVLLMRSPQDHVVPASSSRLILDRISSTDVTEVLLDNSYHVATLDNDADRIAKESLAFISRMSGGNHP
jgi:carboxylesterase